eukprot:CAMPEP_0197722234 /NCGR_PEP_ID=MMETSP1434-20131217/4996_1 /TAXON_ID=265543 /ORGANISM="Minutocellus polymorphus, Strain CCMP3303" /LENGTH=428 /DNA_ID=CAMNT_0043307353 /DNA_START=143 /DNA_END=1429 /DNA_ORIENTATION=+
MSSRDEEIQAAAAVVATAAECIAMLISSSNEAVASVVSVAAEDEDVIGRNIPHAAGNKYLRSSGALQDPSKSDWKLIDTRGRPKEFMHFMSLAGESFDDLVELCSKDVIATPLRSYDGERKIGKPRPHDLKRRKHSPRDVIAMAVKWLTSTAEEKDLHVQFGAIESTFNVCIWVGMKALVKNMADDARSRVFWNIADEDYLKRCADRTADFDKVPNVVAAIDGYKIRAKNDENDRRQNDDFTGWKEAVFRDYVFVTDTEGKVVDAAVNWPGSMHDSKKALWSHIYDHILKLPAPYRVAADSAFRSTGPFKDKMHKTKWKKDKSTGWYVGVDDTGSQLTHLRQPAEWSNHCVGGVYRRLMCKLPTDNVKRGYILWSCVFLTNWRTSTMHRNQIDTYFAYLVEERRRRAAEARSRDEGGGGAGPSGSSDT